MLGITYLPFFVSTPSLPPILIVEQVIAGNKGNTGQLKLGTGIRNSLAMMLPGRKECQAGRERRYAVSELDFCQRPSQLVFFQDTSNSSVLVPSAQKFGHPNSTFNPQLWPALSPPSPAMLSPSLSACPLLKPPSTMSKAAAVP